MADYIEMHTAQVRTRARAFTYMYSKLQHLLKSRTKAGYINGHYIEEMKPDGEFNWNKKIIHDSDTIKLTVAVNKSNMPFRRSFYITFNTKH